MLRTLRQVTIWICWHSYKFILTDTFVIFSGFKIDDSSAGGKTSNHTNPVGYTEQRQHIKRPELVLVSLAHDNISITMIMNLIADRRRSIRYGSSSSRNKFRSSLLFFFLLFPSIIGGRSVPILNYAWLFNHVDKILLFIYTYIFPPFLFFVLGQKISIQSSTFLSASVLSPSKNSPLVSRWLLQSIGSLFKYDKVTNYGTKPMTEDLMSRDKTDSLYTYVVEIGGSDRELKRGMQSMFDSLLIAQWKKNHHNPLCPWKLRTILWQKVSRLLDPRPSRSSSIQSFDSRSSFSRSSSFSISVHSISRFSFSEHSRSSSQFSIFVFWLFSILVF